MSPRPRMRGAPPRPPGGHRGVSPRPRMRGTRPRPPGGYRGGSPRPRMRGTRPRPPGRRPARGRRNFPRPPPREPLRRCLPKRAPSASSSGRWSPPPRPRPSGGGAGAAHGPCLWRCGLGFSGRTSAPRACSTGCRPARWPTPAGPRVWRDTGPAHRPVPGDHAVRRCRGAVQGHSCNRPSFHGTGVR